MTAPSSLAGVTPPGDDPHAPRLGARLARLRPASPVALVGLALIGIWLAWAASRGGFFPTGWGPTGTFFVLLLGIAALASPPLARGLGKARAAMLVALAAFVGWNFLSMTWAEFPSDAWIGSDKTLLYAAGFALFACWEWGRRDALAAIGLFGLGVAVVGIVTLARGFLAADPVEIFGPQRLSAPITYANASVALWMLGFWPCAHLGSSRGVPLWLRSAFLGAATLLLGLAVLGESRGWFLIAPVAAVVYLLLARQRLRALLGLALPAAATLAVTGPILDVGGQGAELARSFDVATGFILGASLCAAAVGAAWAALDERVDVTPRLRRIMGAAAVLLALAALGGAAAAFLARVDDPSAWIERRWQDFTGENVIETETETRLTGSFESNRYEEWKIAWLEFREHPVVGIGSDNYLHAYLERRTSHTDARYPLSTPLRILSQLGIVGAVLLATAFGIAIALALRRRRALDPLAGGASGAALAVFAYWFLHSSVDWFWEIPALAAPAFGLLALAGARLPPAAPATAAAGTAPAGSAAGGGGLRRRLPAVAARALVGLAVLGAGAALVLPWLSWEYRRAAAGEWLREPERAYAHLERSARLNPLGADMLVLKGTIAIRRRDAEVARDALERALEREPRNWYAIFQLGLLEGYLGDYEAARAYVVHAQELNPRDGIIGHALRQIDRGREIDPDRINGLYLRRLNARAGRELYPDVLEGPLPRAEAEAVGPRPSLHFPEPALQ